MVLGGPPEAVLGGEEPDEPHAGRFPEKDGGVFETRIHRGLVGEKREPPATEQGPATGQQHL
jgi:hypothetical protein